MIEESPRQVLRSPALLATGEVEGAHKRVAIDSSRAGARVHMYLHRSRGDHLGALYFYRQADKAIASGTHEAERRAIKVALSSLLNKSSDIRVTKWA